MSDDDSSIPGKIRDSRDGGFLWIDNEIIDDYVRRVGLAAFATYAVLCRHANNKTGRCFPSQRIMAQKMGCCLNTIKASTKVLVAEGLISIERDGHGPQAKNIYTILAIPEGRIGTKGLDTGAFRCWYCGIVLTETEAEHPRPISRGGADDELVQSCKPCNRRKAALNVEEFRQLFPQGHKFYAETMGQIMPHQNVAHDGAQSDLSMGQQVTTNKTKPNKTQEEEILILVWEYYLEKLKRNARTYMLTDKRRKQGMARVLECLKKTEGDFSEALVMLKAAVDKLASSTFHIDNGFTDWEQLFRSQEKFENWFARKGGGNAKGKSTGALHGHRENAERYAEGADIIIE